MHKKFQTSAIILYRTTYRPQGGAISPAFDVRTTWQTSEKCRLWLEIKRVKKNNIEVWKRFISLVSFPHHLSGALSVPRCVQRVRHRDKKKQKGIRTCPTYWTHFRGLKRVVKDGRDFWSASFGTLHLMKDRHSARGCHGSGVWRLDPPLRERRREGRRVCCLRSRCKKRKIFFFPPSSFIFWRNR